MGHYKILTANDPHSVLVVANRYFVGSTRRVVGMMYDLNAASEAFKSQPRSYSELRRVWYGLPHGKAAYVDEPHDEEEDD